MKTVILRQNLKKTVSNNGFLDSFADFSTLLLGVGVMLMSDVEDIRRDLL